MSDLINQMSAESLVKVAEKFQEQVGVGKEGVDAPAFEEVLQQLISDVDSAQKEADESIQSLVASEPTSIHDVVLKMEEADLAFKLMKEIRDKLVTAYKEVISMQ